jgi:hypothetical protein
MSHLLVVVGLVGAVAVAPLTPSRPCALAPDDEAWAQRARFVFRTRNSCGRSQAQRHGAEAVTLAGGRRCAAAGFGRLLRERPLSDPLRFQAAYAMALLDLDYEASREVLIQYLQGLALGESTLDWDRFVTTDADPGLTNDEDPDDRRSHSIWPEAVLGLIFEVCGTRKDPVLLDALLELAPFTDGCAGEGMSFDLMRLSKSDTRFLLTGLAPAEDGVWKAVGLLLAISGPSKLPAETFPQVAQLAVDPADELSPTAQRLLDAIADAQA